MIPPHRSLPQPFPQGQQGSGGSPAEPVDLPQLRLILFGAFLHIAPGVPVPGLFLPPGPLSPDAPQHAVVLQPVRLLRVQTCQAGFQTGKYIIVGKAPCGGVQRVQHKGGQARLPQAGSLLHKGGDAVFPEHRLQKPASGGKIRRRHGKVGKPQVGPLPQKLQDAGSGKAALPGVILHMQQLHRRRVAALRQGPRPRAVQPFRQPPQGGGVVLLSPAPEDAGLRSPGRRQTGEAQEGILGQAEFLPFLLPQGEGDGEIRAPAKEGLQHRRFRSGEVRKAIRPDPASAYGGILRHIRQAAYPVPAVPQPAGEGRPVGLLDERQVVQLVPDAASGGLRGAQQLLRLRHGAFQLLHRIQEAVQPVPPPSPVPVAPEQGRGLLHGQGQEQELRSLIRNGVRQSSQLRRRAAVQPGKAQHLPVEAEARTAIRRQGALRPVGLLLRGKKDQPGLPGLHGLPELPVDEPGLPGPRPSQHQRQHPSPPFFSIVQICLLYHASEGKSRKKRGVSGKETPCRTAGKAPLSIRPEGRSPFSPDTPGAPGGTRRSTAHR